MLVKRFRTSQRIASIQRASRSAKNGGKTKADTLYRNYQIKKNEKVNRIQHDPKTQNSCKHQSFANNKLTS